MKEFRKVCIGCNKNMKKPTKEHFWPKWLIKHTNMEKHKITWWNGNLVYPLTATIPLCQLCNSSLGSELEAAMQKIVIDIENGRGISDSEAEIFIRWCWKMEGFAWRLYNPRGQYSQIYTIKDRALKKIDQIRPRLVLAIALLENAISDEGYKPLGLCNLNEKNAIVVSGVISNIAFIVLTDDQIGNLPINYTYYRLNAIRDNLSSAKLFYPQAGFKEFTEAKYLTRQTATTISRNIDREHN